MKKVWVIEKEDGFSTTVTKYIAVENDDNNKHWWTSTIEDAEQFYSEASADNFILKNVYDPSGIIAVRSYWIKIE